MEPNENHSLNVYEPESPTMAQRPDADTFDDTMSIASSTAHKKPLIKRAWRKVLAY
jgi:hypothetical protein